MSRKPNTEIEQLLALLEQGVAVVGDFMPNIRHCALQDYGRLNEFLIESAKVLAARDALQEQP